MARIESRLGDVDTDTERAAADGRGDIGGLLPVDIGDADARAFRA